MVAHCLLWVWRNFVTQHNFVAIERLFLPCPMRFHFKTVHISLVTLFLVKWMIHNTTNNNLTREIISPSSPLIITYIHKSNHSYHIYYIYIYIYIFNSYIPHYAVNNKHSCLLRMIPVPLWPSLFAN